MKKKWIWIAAIVLLAAGGYAVRAYRDDAAAKQIPPEIATVERGNIRIIVGSQGVVQSNLDVEIKCKASGEIVTLPYDVSDPVEEGALLVELDPIDEQRNVGQAEVQLASSKARLDQARQTLATAELEVKNARQEAESALRSAEAQAKDRREKAERTKALFEKKYASPEECETAETEAVSAAESLEMARVKLKQIEVQEQNLEVIRQDIVLAECKVQSDSIALQNAEQRLKYTKVYAPMAGVVSERYVQIGQIISSPTSNVGGGTPLLMLSDLSRVFVLAAVDESEIGKITVGQTTDITVDAFPGLHFPGEVVRISTKGKNVSNVVTFEVKIEVLSEDKNKLRPEMTANVDIQAAEKTDVLLLPSECVIRRGEKNFVTLPAPPGQEGERRPVQIGLDDGQHVEIVSGLEEGMKVAIVSGGGSGRFTQGGLQDSAGRDRMRNQMLFRGFGGGRSPR